MRMISRGYQRALIGCLLLVNIVNYMDRSLIGILGESLKRDLLLNDTELGLIAGGVFTVTYSLLGLPAARVADRGWRKRVVMISVFVWCAMTCSAGLARTFWELAIARIGVALGEGGVLPASHAMISLQVDRERQASAIGLLSIGAALAAFVGGWTNQRFGWRATFVALGLCGLLLTPLIHFVIRRDQESTDGSVAAAPTLESGTFGVTVRYLASLRSYRMLWLAAGLMVIGQSAYLVYSGPFFIRSYGLSTMVVGRYIALTVGVGATVGALTGGRLFDWLGRRSYRLALTVPAVTVLLSACIGTVGWASDHVSVTAFCLFASTFLYALVTAPVYTTAQLLAPAHMRSTSAAVLNIGIGAIGMAVGPLLAGVVSDLTRPSLGIHSLRAGLIVVAVLQAIGALVLFRAASAVDDDLASV